MSTEQAIYLVLAGAALSFIACSFFYEHKVRKLEHDRVQITRDLVNESNRVMLHQRAVASMAGELRRVDDMNLKMLLAVCHMLRLDIVAYDEERGLFIDQDGNDLDWWWIAARFPDQPLPLSLPEPADIPLPFNVIDHVGNGDNGGAS